MNHANNAHIFHLFLATITLVLFTAIAALVIVAWIPVLPEAIAADIGQGKDLSQYMQLHESWHYSARLHDPLALAYCVK